MQQPRNRQEFLALQEQAVAAARDMQRRATLPVPRQAAAQAAGDRRQGAGEQPWFRQAPPQPKPSPKQPPRRPEGMHHPRPEGMHHPRPGRRKEPPGYTPFKPVAPPPPPPPPPEASHTPPPSGIPSPPLSQLFQLFGNLGGGATGKQEPHASQEPPASAPGEPPQGDGMDSILTLLLLFLLKKENADQGLLMALMYILM